MQMPDEYLICEQCRDQEIAEHARYKAALEQIASLPALYTSIQQTQQIAREALQP